MTESDILGDQDIIRSIANEIEAQGRPELNDCDSELNSEQGGNQTGRHNPSTDAASSDRKSPNDGLYPFRPGDDPKMRHAIKSLYDAGIRAWRPSGNQLKFRDLNFWPGTGKITRDGGPKIAARGFKEFLRITVAEKEVRKRRKASSATESERLPRFDPKVIVMD